MTTIDFPFGAFEDDIKTQTSLLHVSRLVPKNINDLVEVVD